MQVTKVEKTAIVTLELTLHEVLVLQAFVQNATQADEPKDIANLRHSLWNTCEAAKNLAYE